MYKKPFWNRPKPVTDYPISKIWIDSLVSPCFVAICNDVVASEFLFKLEYNLRWKDVLLLQDALLLLQKDA